MIPYEQARKLVIEKAKLLGQEVVTLDEALGRVVAKDISSKINVPPFRNSAMDGYAVRSEDTKQAKRENYVSLKLVAAQPAGDYFRKRIRNGKTVKVMTGAPVPAGADAVVPLEEVEQRGEQILIRREIKPGENIREAGEDVKKGEIIIRKGSVLKTPELGLLAACGFTQVSVYRRPQVAVIITGNELCEPGEKLQAGKIYNSNAVILKALLKSSGVELVSLEKVEDNLKSLISALKRAV
ncbi:MAG TPA: molybdopterin molybdotransferase MoeA, partial [Candidatus Saccharicenans sp.]|nr:molybdopterin molybdotransferase MoeA [Candidatus Saccharicenans sp.]